MDKQSTITSKTTALLWDRRQFLVAGMGVIAMPSLASAALLPEGHQWQPF